MSSQGEIKQRLTFNEYNTNTLELGSQMPSNPGNALDPTLLNDTSAFRQENLNIFSDLFDNNQGMNWSEFEPCEALMDPNGNSEEISNCSGNDNIAFSPPVRLDDQREEAGARNPGSCHRLPGAQPREASLTTPPSSNEQGCASKSRRYPIEKWNEMKPILQMLYIDQGRSLSSAKRILEEEHDFIASYVWLLTGITRSTDGPIPREKQYKNRLRSWGLKKNSVRNAPHAGSA